jgi:hypothetical protein
VRETLRQTRRPAGLLAAAAAVVLLGATQVRAQDVGFVWNNNPTTAGTTTPDSAYSFNSSGGAIAITRNAKGNYTVTFTGLGNGLNSNVVVSAYGAGPDFCVSDGWTSPNGTDVTANVLCYNKLGDLADHSFTLLYQARVHGNPTTPSVAFLLANEPSAANYTPDLTYQYNPGGALNTMTRSSAGNYTATLPDLTSKGGTVIVSAYGGAPAHCQVTDWSNSSAGTTVNVNCTNAGGIAADEEFTLVYSISETAGYSPGSANGGAIWANKDKDSTPYDVSTKYSIPIDGEEMFAQRTAKGKYTWTMNVEDQWTSSTVLVTAYGAPGNYCATNYWSTTSTTTTVYVDCFSAAGAPADTRFTATFQLAGVD